MPDVITAQVPPATTTPLAEGHRILDNEYFGPLSPPPPPPVNITTQTDPAYTPTQVHRTATENGVPSYFEEEDPKPELADEPTAEGDAATVSATGNPALTPVRGHWFFHDRDGNPYYEDSPGVAALAVPALVGRHLTVPDSQGVPNYLSNDGVTTGPDQTSMTADLATDPAVHYLVGDGNGPPEYITFTDDPNESDTASLSTDTQATACDTHITFGGQDEPVEYHCPRGAFEPDPSGGSVPPAGLRIVARTANPPQPVILPATSSEQAHAALFTASLWHTIAQAGGPRPLTQAHAHIPRVFDPAWLARGSTPTREVIPEGLSVTLGGGGFERYPDHAAMLAAYEHQPRTWIFERTNHAIPWISQAAAYLGRLSASPLEVLAAMFDSRPEDDAPGLHTDEWYSVIVQFDGAKHWTIGTGPHAHQLTTEPGDVLLIPEGLAHATTTPTTPGYSRHLAISLCRHTEYTRATPNQPTQQRGNACASFSNDPRRPGACKKCGYSASEH